METSKFKTWKVYPIAFSLATEIFRLSVHFPKSETYSLTDQVRRSSRSVCANLAEASARRKYPKHLYAKLADCAGENYETQVWLDFALDAGYIERQQHQELMTTSHNVGRLLSYMQSNLGQYLLK